MGIKVPSGVLIPDVSGGDDGMGCLFGGFVVLIVLAGAADSCSRSGAAEPGRENILSQQSLCASDVADFQQFDNLARQAFDSGEPQSQAITQRIARQIGASLLPQGSAVQVVRRGNDQFTLVSVGSDPAANCWVPTNALKMGWAEWLAWKWSERQKQSALARERSARATAFEERVATKATTVVACLTGTHRIEYRGTQVSEAFPVDFSRCLARQGRVQFRGAKGGVVYQRDGSVLSDLVLSNAVVLLAGPRGTSATMSCDCSSAPGAQHPGQGAASPALGDPENRTAAANSESAPSAVQESDESRLQQFYRASQYLSAPPAGHYVGRLEREGQEHALLITVHEASDRAYAAVSYPDLGCTGQWLRPRIMAGVIEVDEEVSGGACSSQGRVRLSYSRSTGVSFQWSEVGGAGTTGLGTAERITDQPR